MRYPTNGRCIYCGRGGILLTDEHIVPLFIGGKDVMEKASCVTCADITKRFEQDVARGLWGEARASYGAPTRRKKERATTYTVKDPARRLPDLLIPVSEHPSPMVFYTMQQAGILLGTDRQKDLSREWQFIVITDEARLQAFQAKHPHPVTGSFTNVPRSFGRLLAKIGHAHLSAVLLQEDFDPVCLPYVLGKKSNVSYVVGSRPTIEPPIPGLGYFTRTVEIGSGDHLLLLVEIRLLANNSTPTYHAVVGQVVGQARIANVQTKLAAATTRALTNGAQTIPIQSEEEFRQHMLPRRWPPEA